MTWKKYSLLAAYVAAPFLALWLASQSSVNLETIQPRPDADYGFLAFITTLLVGAVERLTALVLRRLDPPKERKKRTADTVSALVALVLALAWFRPVDLVASYSESVFATGIDVLIGMAALSVSSAGAHLLFGLGDDATQRAKEYIKS